MNLWRSCRDDVDGCGYVYVPLIMSIADEKCTVFGAMEVIVTHLQMSVLWSRHIWFHYIYCHHVPSRIYGW